MELKLVLRGLLAGIVAGVLGFVFARIFAEPEINKAIDYEGARHAAEDALLRAQGVASEMDDHEIFSRSVQSTVGLATGIIVFSAAMGALVAVAYLVLHGRIAGLRPRNLAAAVAAFGFLGVYLVPFAKYPANPPSVGHDSTIDARSQLYLTMVLCSLVFLAVAAYAGRRLRPRLGAFTATVVAAAGFLVAIGIVMVILPSYGHLSANRGEFGNFATETPQPLLDSQGRLVFPGFPADTLWNFRFYSVIAQLIVWTTIGLVFAKFVERVVEHPRLELKPTRETASA